MEANESRHPLLNDESCCEQSVDTLYANSGRHKSRLTGLRPFLFHGLLVLAYSAVFFVSWIQVPTIHSNGALIPSPAREALRYEKKVFYSDVKDNPFAGPPRAELDGAWHKLLRNIHIQLSKEEADSLTSRTLELSDGTGYVSSLEVYHDLHCLKRIRHFLYQDVYLPNMTTAERDFELFHTEHCLEHLREVVMCRGDVALTSFFYRGHKPTAKLLAEHECINWEALDGWTAERAIDLSIPGLILPEEQSEHI